MDSFFIFRSHSSGNLQESFNSGGYVIRLEKSTKSGITPSRYASISVTQLCDPR